MFERRVVGKVPRKHHIQLRDDKGTLMFEECLTRDGFEGPYTIAYHQKAPHTQSLGEAKGGWELPQAVPEQRLAKRHYKTQELPRKGGAPLNARVPLLFNADVTLAVLHPTEADSVYFTNADADDLFYIHQGSGVVRSVLGDLRFGPEDYVFIPRGLVHRILPDPGVPQYWLSMECKGGVHLPRQWRNDVGQLRMDAPYSHRDFKVVEFTGPQDEGIRDLVVKRKREMARAAGQKLVAQLRAGQSMQQVAAASGLQVGTAGPFARAEPNPALGQANAAIGAAFGTPVGQVSNVVETQTGLFIIRPTQRIPADRKAWEAQKEQQRMGITYQMQQSVIQRWLESARREAEIVDNRGELGMA